MGGGAVGIEIEIDIDMRVELAIEVCGEIAIGGLSVVWRLISRVRSMLRVKPRSSLIESETDTDVGFEKEIELAVGADLRSMRGLGLILQATLRVIPRLRFGIEIEIDVEAEVEATAEPTSKIENEVGVEIEIWGGGIGNEI